MSIKGRYISNFICLHPSVLIAAGLLNGIIPFFLFSGNGYLTAISISLCAIIFLYLFIKFFDISMGDKNKEDADEVILHTMPIFFISTRFFVPVAKFALFTAIGWGLSFYTTIPSSDNYIRQLPHLNCSADIKVRFCDKTDPGDAVTWLSHPRQVEAEVLSMRISSFSPWIKSSGNVMLKFPKRQRGYYSGNSLCSNTIEALDYGNEAILHGAFIEPHGALFYGDFDYRRYLRIKGIRKLYYVRSVEKIDSDAPFYVSLMQKILIFRNTIMCRMGEGMELKNRKMLAALMFGCRQGLDFASRRTFLQSGVIHIFAISGLHVGMIAVTLYLLFVWTPFRFRYLFVPFLLAVYVITTGLHTSALRALLMISIWSVMKAFLYRTSPLNIVFLAASIILIINPLEIFGAGFQFSFTIALFLVLAWGSVKEWLTFLQERSLWIPSKLLSFKDHFTARIKRGVFNSFITSLVAWLSGSVILLVHRSFLIPGAVFTNFLIIPFVWILFVVALFDVLLMPFYKIFTLNPIMEFFLNVIRAISSAGAEFGGGGNMITPSWYIVVIFFAALLFFVTARRRRTFFVSGAVIFLLCFTLFMTGKLQKERIVLFYGGESQEPAVVSIPPNGGSGVTVINPGSKPRSKAILSFLEKNGVNSIDYLIFSENRKSCCEAAWLIFSGINVKQVIFSSGYHRSRYAKFAMKKALSSSACVRVISNKNSEDGSTVYSVPGINFIKMRDSDYKLKIIRLEWSTVIYRKHILQGEKRITISTPNIQKEYNLINSNRLTLIE